LIVDWAIALWVLLMIPKSTSEIIREKSGDSEVGGKFHIGKTGDSGAVEKVLHNTKIITIN